jgi:hypothetical protein
MANAPRFGPAVSAGLFGAWMAGCCLKDLWDDRRYRTHLDPDVRAVANRHRRFALGGVALGLGLLTFAIVVLLLPPNA